MYTLTISRELGTAREISTYLQDVAWAVQKATIDTDFGPIVPDDLEGPGFQLKVTKGEVIH